MRTWTSAYRQGFATGRYAGLPARNGPCTVGWMRTWTSAYRQGFATGRYAGLPARNGPCTVGWMRTWTSAYRQGFATGRYAGLPARNGPCTVGWNADVDVRVPTRFRHRVVRGPPGPQWALHQAGVRTWTSAYPQRRRRAVRSECVLDACNERSRPVGSGAERAMGHDGGFVRRIADQELHEHRVPEAPG